MFGTIRKHQTWLWVVIISVVSVSMVVFFSSNAGLSGPSGKDDGDYGSMNGQPFNGPEFIAAKKELLLGYLIRTGRPPNRDEATDRALERETISRLFLIHKLKDMDIHPSDKAVGAMMEEQIRDYPLEKFEQDFLRPNNLTVADYKRFLAHEVGVRQLFSAAAVSARLVNPKEAEEIFRREHQDVAVEIAGFWATNFLDKVVITNGAISSWYSNRMGFYRVPERTVISYVAFEPSNFLAEAGTEVKKITNINDLVTKAYFEKGTNDWKDAGGLVLSEIDAKKKILDDVHLRFALTAARRAAADFGTRLMNQQPDPNKAENLDKLAAASGLQVKVTKPFDRASGLEEFAAENSELSRDEESFADTLRRRAFNLTPEQPILFNPIPGRHGIYLIAFKQKVRSELPPLDNIREKVTSDYRRAMALDLAVQTGRSFQAALTNGLAAKKSFDQICSAEKVKPVELPLFAPSTRALTNLDARIEFRQLQTVTADLSVAEASGFIRQAEGGYVAYVKARPPIGETKLKAELPEFIANLRQYRQSEAFQQWFRRQAELAKLAPPKRETAIGPPN